MLTKLVIFPLYLNRAIVAYCFEVVEACILQSLVDNVGNKYLIA